MLAVSDLSYVFPGNHVRAIDRIDLELEPGRIHALLGENGAGKSTLARVICGHVRGWQGNMSLGGRAYLPQSPRDALAKGVALVPQHPRLDRDLDVGRNLFLGHGLEGTVLYTPGIRKLLQDKLDAWGMDLDIREPAANLDAARIHWTAIAEALLAEPSWIFLDEPSAAYPEEEVQRLYGLLSACAGRGMGVVVITHRLREVETHADRCHILKSGALIYSTPPEGRISGASIFDLMFDHGPGGTAAAPEPGTGTPLVRLPPGSPLRDQPPDHRGLEIRNLRVPTGKHRTALVHMHIAPKRIQGILGHWDQGLEALEDYLAGILPCPGGAITLDGRPVHGLAPQLRGYIPSRRFQRGIALGLSIRDTVLIRLRHQAQSRKNGPFTDSLRAQLPLDTERSWQDPVETLSGGMIQKLLICREMELPVPQLLIASEPWWGLDFRAQDTMARKLREFAAPNRVALVLSSDIDEIMALCTHACVLGPRGMGQTHELAGTPRSLWEQLLFHPQGEVQT